MTSLETIKAKISEINAKKQELVADLRKDFAPMLKPLFEKSKGKIKSFGWTQYTPYFNDGDSCEFGVNFDYPNINGVDYDDIENINKGIYKQITDDNIIEHKEFNKTKGYHWYVDKQVGQDGYFPNPDYDYELVSIIDDFKSALSDIDSEFLKELFGDHVLVTVNDDGTIETEEYEHD